MGAEISLHAPAIVSIFISSIIMVPLTKFSSFSSRLSQQDVDLPHHDLSEVIHGNYAVEYQIGKGAFSEVFLAINKLNQSKVAIKRINILTLTQGLTALTNELQVFQRIGSHDNIVNLHCAYRLKNYFYFVMDCLPGGDLRQFLHRNGQLSEQAICYIIASLGSGLHHMHQQGVFHRDIKPENIAFDSVGTPCLTDFGISHIATADSSPFVSCESSGTLPYLAPETLTRSHQHSYQSDFWSLGVVAHELLYGQTPFDPHVPFEFIYFAGNNYSKLFTISSAHSPLLFPHYDVTLNQDGTVPSSLRVHLHPTRPSKSSSSPESVSQQMRDLLSGLLDVRIPQRLGSMARFEDFSENSAFLQYGYHTSNGLFSSPSPLLEEDQDGVLCLPIHSPETCRVSNRAESSRKSTQEFAILSTCRLPNNDGINLMSCEPLPSDFNFLPHAAPGEWVESVIIV